MKKLVVVAIAFISGAVGCGGESSRLIDINRSSALAVIEKSPEFLATNFIPSDFVFYNNKVEISRGDGMSNCGSDQSLRPGQFRTEQLVIAEEYGLVMIESIDEPGINCTSKFKRGVLTDAGRDAIVADGEEAFTFRAINLKVANINGIRLNEDKTSAVVLFNVSIDKNKKNYERLVSGRDTAKGVSENFTAVLALYDDGWRVENLSRSN